MKKLINKYVITTVLVYSLLPVQEVFATQSLAANVAVTNNYLWRGLEQTNGAAAISAGIDFDSASGFYLGSWVSTADWASGMNYELDIYAGFTGETNDVSYGFGVIHYAYPGSIEDLDFTELNANISMGAYSLTYFVLANANTVDFADDTYISLDIEFDVFSDVGLAIHLGKGMDEFYAGEAYIDYGISLNKNGFSFAFSKTDLENDDAKFIISYTIDINL